MVDIIISCPSKLFYNVSLPVSLWFLSKNKNGDRFRKRKGEILFIDARETFEQISRKQVVFNSENIKKITDTVKAWRGEAGTGTYEDISGFCKSANLEEIKKNGYVLTPGRYVGLADIEDDGISFEEKMQKLSHQLREAFTKGRELEKEIEKNLKELEF
jgi:type I restriction enzyme M protein